MTYATFEDVAARWVAPDDEAVLTEEDRPRVSVLLDDAAVFLRGWVRMDETDTGLLDALRIVSCNVVIRAMVASRTMPGAESVQYTMGPFGQTVSMANPNGDMYLTRQERKLLAPWGTGGRILHPHYGPDVRDA